MEVIKLFGVDVRKKPDSGRYGGWHFATFEDAYRHAKREERRGFLPYWSIRRLTDDVVLAQRKEK